MKLDRVTITGADDSIEPSALFDLSKEFPFVEWGILFSQKHAGTPRWPTHAWCSKFGDWAEGALRLSAHLCGGYMRDLLRGEFTFAQDHTWFFHQCQRVQLNFHAEPQQVIGTRFVAAMQEFSRRHGDSGEFKRQWIFQIDGVNDHLFETGRQQPDVPDLVPLFDGSHGAGVLPGGWPKSRYRKHTTGFKGDGFEAFLIYHGYAGGLGPENLADQIPLIAAAAADAPFWIDMETRIRSDNDRVFDLAKVRRCLEIAAPFIYTK